jgi:hypothetical protein
MSNVNKPVISAEVADAIERARKHRWSNERIAQFVLDPDHTMVGVLALHTIPFDTLLAALINGYEREKSPEDIRHEEIRKEFVWRNGSITEYSSGMADGIRYAVAMLGVKIEGVNA